MSIQFKNFSLEEPTYKSGKVTYIYGLTNPNKYFQIFYIGKTWGKTVNSRCRDEIQEAKDGHKCHRCNAIRKILETGVSPQWLIIEICDENNWKERESYWIKYYRDCDYGLANQTDGGCGGRGTGFSHSLETRLKISLTHTGRRYHISTEALLNRAGKKRGPYRCVNKFKGIKRGPNKNKSILSPRPKFRGRYKKKEIEMKIVDITTAEQLKVFFEQLCNKEYSNLLDIGCGKDAKLIKDIKCETRTGIEIFKPYFDEAYKNRLYSTLICGDARHILKSFYSCSFDVVLAIDFIEHSIKSESAEVLQEIDRIAKKEILLFTPYKFYHQDAFEENPYQEHKSGWDENDFPGFDVYLLPKMHGTGALVLHKRKE